MPTVPSGAITTLQYDNAPTGRKCTHCPERARWWVNKDYRHRNLCDKHFAMSLRKDAGLKKLKFSAVVEGVA
jgi:hypothetical protein